MRATESSRYVLGHTAFTLALQSARLLAIYALEAQGYRFEAGGYIRPPKGKRTKAQDVPRYAKRRGVRF